MGHRAHGEGCGVHFTLGELETAGGVRREDMGSGLRLYGCLKLAGFARPGGAAAPGK